MGRHLGMLRGLATGMRSFLESSKHICTEGCKEQGLHEKVKDICDNLALVQFSDIEPPDPEAIEHAETHNTSSTPRRTDAYKLQNRKLEDLSALQATLMDIIVKLDMGKLSGLYYVKPDFSTRFMASVVEEKSERI